MIRITPLVLAAVAGLVGTAVAPAHAETATKPAADEQLLPAITVTTVAARDLRDIVLASGMVGAVEEVQVAPLIEGQPIEELLADVGDTVAAGQVLARLSSSTLTLQKAQLDAQLTSAQAQIAQAQAQLVDATAARDEARRVADRTARLRAQGTSTQAALDQAQAAATSADARVAVATQAMEAARAQVTVVQAQADNVALMIARTEVRAPVAGQIIARNAQIGAVASAAGQPMFTLIRDGALELNADVAEADLSRLARGQTASLTFVGAAVPQTGTLRLVEPTIDRATRLGRVRISLPDSTAIRAGMFAEAAILVSEHKAPAVPVTAIGSAAGQSTVMLVKDGVAHQQPVTLGIRDGGWVEVTEGVAVGDSIVLRAGAFVRNGDHIHPVAAPADVTN